MTMTALDSLQWNWDEAYAITAAAGHWLAQRRDNGRTLSASSPAGLREMIIEDYAAEPVAGYGLMTGGPVPATPSTLVEADALRAAFPGYVVNVITRWGEKARFEVVSRDGGSPYALISSDAQEIWRELRAH